MIAIRLVNTGARLGGGGPAPARAMRGGLSWPHLRLSLDYQSVPPCSSASNLPRFQHYFLYSCYLFTKDCVGRLQAGNVPERPGYPLPPNQTSRVGVQ